MSIPALPRFRLRPTPAIPWRPLTDAEWRALASILRAATGRPPADARRRWDGIFWVACSKGPWRGMPAEFGRADSAHRALRRAAAARQLHAMLARIGPATARPDEPLLGIAWFIARAFRRAFRVMASPFALPTQLGLESALPSHPAFLPSTTLSEGLADLMPKIVKEGSYRHPAVLRCLFLLLKRAGGDPRHWKTTG
ncbi:transposase [Falsiroseomonas sp. HW251]|uniref:transposase n=1 Tax=Falsiroseomonas sp. HW251 TaxID=3390998 RepID=UPI003D30FACB